MGSLYVCTEPSVSVRINGQAIRVTRLSQGPLAIMSNLPQQFTATKEQFENGSVTKFKTLR